MFSFMSRIYEEAQLAIVWLGLPSDDRREARAIDFINEMAKHRPDRSAGASFRDLYLSEKAHPRWLNLLLLCKCRYWTRTWIIQEFVQAQRIEVLCGTAKLDWTAFDTVYQFVRSLSLPVNSALDLPLQTTLKTFLSTIPARLTSRRLGHTASLLVELLHEFYDAECTLPRDKVYGMLGIAADCGQLSSIDDPNAASSTYRGPVPDYTKHIVEVYFDVLNYLRDSSQTRSVAPLTVILLQKSLHITEQAIAHFTNTLSAEALVDTVANTTLYLKPDYISTISATIPSYTSSSDLRQKLTQFDWSPYVGFEIVRPRTPTPTPPSATSSNRRPSRPTAIPFRASSGFFSPITSSSSLSTASTLSPIPSKPEHRRHSSSSSSIPLSRQITQTAPIPSNLISNAITFLTTHDPLLSSLRSYLDTSSFHLPLHPTDPPSPTLPPHQTLLISPSPLSHPLRLGFAPTSSNPTLTPRRNDLILQFHNLNLTLIARRLHSSSTLHLISHAVMITHDGIRMSPLGRESVVHPATTITTAKSSGSIGDLISPCLIAIDDDTAAGGIDSAGVDDQEQIQRREQWREYMKQFDDVEIETDALSLFGILKDA